MVWTLTTYHLSLTVLVWALAAVALPTVQGKMSVCFQLIASLPNIDPHVLGLSPSDLEDCVFLAFTQFWCPSRGSVCVLTLAPSSCCILETHVQAPRRYVCWPHVMPLARSIWGSWTTVLQCFSLSVLLLCLWRWNAMVCVWDSPLLPSHFMLQSPHAAVTQARWKSEHNHSQVFIICSCTWELMACTHERWNWSCKRHARVTTCMNAPPERLPASSSSCAVVCGHRKPLAEAELCSEASSGFPSCHPSLMSSQDVQTRNTFLLGALPVPSLSSRWTNQIAVLLFSHLTQETSLLQHLSDKQLCC